MYLFHVHNARVLLVRVFQALTTMVSELSTVLAGKSGVLAQWYQRHSLIMALEGVRSGVISAGLPATPSAELAAHVVDALLPVVEKESHEDTRAVGLGCLARWILFLDAIPSKLVEYLKVGMGSTRFTTTACAGVVCELSGVAHMGAQLAPLLPDLFRRIEIGVQKPNVFHPDAIYSAKAVLDIAAAVATVGDEVDKRFPWQALSVPASFLFPTGILAPQFADVPLAGQSAGPLARHTCTALCQVIALGAEHISAASSRPSRIESLHMKPISDTSCLALVRCTVLHNSEVRQAALDAATVLCNTTDDAQLLLLQAFQHVRETAHSSPYCPFERWYLISDGLDHIDFDLAAVESCNSRDLIKHS